jgi:hypothetical protein
MRAGSDASPWAWRPSKAAWHRLVAMRVDTWDPGRETVAEGDADVVRRRIGDAANRGAQWLYDPAIAALLAPRDSGTHRRDLQLLALLAANDASVRSCRVTLPIPTEIALADGSAVVGPGLLTLGELAAPLTSPARSEPALGRLDFCGRTVAYEGDDAREGAASTERLFVTVRRLLAGMPECRDWLAPVFRAVVPTKKLIPDQTSSRSYAYFPGVVFSDFQSGLAAAAEAVVHECAHHYFHLHELGGDLVVPGHDVSAWSPFARRERPLSRVLLAFHALAYMACLYRELLSAKTVERRVALMSLEDLARQDRDYVAVLAEHRDHLTPRGRRFAQATRAAASWGLSRSVSDGGERR